ILCAGSRACWSGALRRDLLGLCTRPALLDLRDHLPAEHGRAVLDEDLAEHARRGRGDFQHDLVGLDVDEVLVALDAVAFLLVPADERRVGDGLRQLRNLDFSAHAFLRFTDFLLSRSSAPASSSFCSSTCSAW